MQVAVGGPDDTADDVAVLAGAGGIKDLYGNDGRTGESNAGDALTVIGRCRGDGRKPGTVAIGVAVRVGSGECGVARNQPSGQVRLAAVDAGVEDGDRRGAGR